MISYRDLLMVSKGNRYPNLRTLLFAKKFKMGGKLVKEYLRTVSGVPCILRNSVGKSVVNYKISGETYRSPEMQYPVLEDKDGYSLYDSENYSLCSSDTPQYIIKSVGNKSKNLLNIQDLMTLTKYSTIKIMGKQNYNYTLSSNAPKGTGSNYLWIYDSKMPHPVYKDNPASIKCQNGWIKIDFDPTIPSAQSILNGTAQIQLEEGLEATEYEPYGYTLPIIVSQLESTPYEPIITTTYLNEPLRKIGDYVDVLDYDSSSAERKINKLIFTGNEQFMDTSYNVFYVNMTGYLRIEGLTLLCSHYQAQGNITDIRDIEDMHCAFNVQNTPSRNRIMFRDTRFNNLIDLRAYIKGQYEAGTPITFYYVLSESNTEALILPSLSTFEGTTSISTDTETRPSNIEITYRSSKNE